MWKSSSSCQAHQERTGDWVCNRCGLQWDKDDDAPDCKIPVTEIRDNKQIGRNAIKKIRKDLMK